MRDALYVLWCARQTRERGYDIAVRKGRREGVEDDDVCGSVAIAIGRASACEIVERAALRSKAVKDEVETLCELEEVARYVGAVVGRVEGELLCLPPHSSVLLGLLGFGRW